MAKTSPLPAWQRAMVVLTGTVVGIVLVACLYWARAIFIPVALAVFLTFLLSPLASTLERGGLGRAPSVILVVLLAGLVLGGVGWMVTRQVVGLVDELPQYTHNIKGKIKSVRAMVEGTGRFGRMVQEITGELKSPPPDSEGGPVPEAAEMPGGPDQPQAVVVKQEIPPWLSWLTATLGSVAELLAGLVLAGILVVFMLLKREDLRNRIIRLIGYGHITGTTKAIDDAGQRISRFLIMQVVINGSFGLALALGMLAIGVKYALLWGFLAAVLRYIPFVGIWIAAIPPIVLSLAMFEGWLQPLLVVGLILAIDLVAVNVLEPWLYGQSMGVSEVALLVSAAFWAWLWGPIGMVLSSPIIAGLVVLGKYVPRLEFLNVLLGDELPLDPTVSFYQRLLARDQDEATHLVLAFTQTAPPEQVYDDLLIPALTFAKRDRARDDLSKADEDFVHQAVEEILEDLGEHRSATTAAEEGAACRTENEAAAVPKVRILGCPARDEADRLALEMLRQLVNPTRCEVEITAVETMTSELLELVAKGNPSLICIGSLPPGGLAHTRYLCKRLRSRFPAMKIVVGRWGLRGNLEQNEEQLREAGADKVETTLLETKNLLYAWMPVLANEKAAPVAEPLEQELAAAAGPTR